MKILVTGGAGFIGSAVIRHILNRGHDDVVNLDCLTYAANLNNLPGAGVNPRCAFEQVNIRDSAAIAQVFEKHQPDAVMHLAAESHVDRSIDGPDDFIQTNIVGTYTLLQAAMSYFDSLDHSRRDTFRFHHVSTDEVFGSLSLDDPAFTPETPYRPRSPYSASKAASDHLVFAWAHTYGLPVILSNCSNNYGPYQFPEKLIPLVTLRALAGETLPVYGTGENVRDWLYVDDHASALLAILKQGRRSETYLVGGNAERSNINVVQAICAILDERFPDASNTPHHNLITYVTDRPGHDLRYAIDASKLINELGWAPSVDFETGLKQTIEWYLENEDWWRPLSENRYDGMRLGLRSAKEFSK